MVVTCTLGALIGFAANSLLTRAAIGGGHIDAVSFTSVRLASGLLAEPLGAFLLGSGALILGGIFIACLARRG